MGEMPRVKPFKTGKPYRDALRCGSVAARLRSDTAGIVLVDPRPFTREALGHFLATEASVCVVRALHSATEVDPDVSADAKVVVLNVGFLLISSGWVSREIGILTDRLPTTPLIVVSDSEAVSEVEAALRLGVRGYIPTTFSQRVALAALRLVVAGGTFIPASAVEQTRKEALLSKAERSEVLTPLHSEPTTVGESMAAVVLRQLGPRQKQVLQLVCEGRSNKTIAYALKMQEGTVKAHVREIMRKLRATNRTQVACLVTRLGGEGVDTR